MRHGSRVRAGLGAEALVYLGLGLVGTAVARARHRRGMGCARSDEHGWSAGYDPEYAHEIDGWVYVDMIADDNPVLAGATCPVGRTRAPGIFAAVGYDLG